MTKKIKVLLMLWSDFEKNGYCVRIAVSSNGKIDGTWLHQPCALYHATERRADGGHGMLFTAPDGTLTLSMHSPNVDSETDPTTAVFVPVADIGNTLILKCEDSLFVRLYKNSLVKP